MSRNGSRDPALGPTGPWVRALVGGLIFTGTSFVVACLLGGLRGLDAQMIVSFVILFLAVTILCRFALRYIKLRPPRG